MIEPVGKKDNSGLAPTSVKIDAELRKRVKLACIERGKTQTDAVEEGLRMWLSLPAEGGGATPAKESEETAKDPRTSVPSGVSLASFNGTKIPDAEKQWIDKLLYVLADGSPGTRAAIMTNLNTFARLTALEGNRDESPEDATEFDRDLEELHKTFDAAEALGRRQRAPRSPRTKVGKRPEERAG